MRIHPEPLGWPGPVASGGALVVVRFGQDLVGNQVDTVRGSQAVIVLDGGNVPAIHLPAVHCTCTRTHRTGFMVGFVGVVGLVARFLEVVLQLLLRIPSALPDSAQLLGRRRRVGVLAMALRVPILFLAHKGIVPPDSLCGKAGPRQHTSGSLGAVPGRCCSLIWGPRRSVPPVRVP